MSDISRLASPFGRADPPVWSEKRLRECKEISVHVLCNEHANLDSLPLRYGIHFSEDGLLALADIRFRRVDPKDDERFHLDARFSDSGGRECGTGHFVVGLRRGYDDLVLITVWRNDIDTETGLSDLMTKLRKNGALTSDDLLDLHPLYLDHRLQTTVDLVNELIRKKVADRIALTESEIETMRALAADAQRNVNAAIAERDRARKQAENARGVALEATYVVDKLEQQNDALSSQVDRLTVELKQEREKARSEGQSVTLSSADTLVDVLEKHLHRGSSCTILLMGDGSQRYMKTATFDREGRVTSKAKALIGQRVRTSCWDPVNEPGKWTRQGYFRNVYVAA